MEKTILRILALQLFDGGGLAIHGDTDQMMPAKNLMKKDPVRKSSEPHAEDEAGPNQRGFLSPGYCLLPGLSYICSPF